MAGTKIGGEKTRNTNYTKYGADYYKYIGSIGGKKAHNINPVTGKALKGFAINGKAAEAGRKGGSISRRGKANETNSDAS